MKTLQLKTACVLSLLAPYSVMAQNSSTEADSAETPLPYQIIIRPQATLTDIRKLIIQVEEDFFDKFNEINIDDDYDIYCYEYVPTMSHIKERVCEPAFMISARGENASSAAANFQGPPGSGGSNRPGSTALFSPSEMRNHMGLEYEILQEKMENFMQTDKEFSEIGSVLAKLRARLQNRKRRK